MQLKQNEDILTRWALLTPQQKETILCEFRKRLPEDYYCKATLVEFLTKKINMEHNASNGIEQRETIL